MKIVRFALIAYDVTLLSDSKVDVDILNESDNIVSMKNLVSRAFTKEGTKKGESVESLQGAIKRYITTDILDEMKGEIECSM